MSARARVLTGYRHMLGAINSAFKGDPTAVAHCRHELRAAVVANKSETDPTKLAAMIEGFDEAAEFLRRHVVQAALNAEGRYAVKLEPGHADKDNNIELAPPSTAKSSTGCCGQC